MWCVRNLSPGQKLPPPPQKAYKSLCKAGPNVQKSRGTVLKNYALLILYCGFVNFNNDMALYLVMRRETLPLLTYRILFDVCITDNMKLQSTKMGQDIIT
jgi:hypothetical protein